MRQFFHHFTEQNKFYFTEHFEQIRVVWLGGLRVLDLQSEGLESTVHWISPSPEFNSIAMLVKCHVLLLASWDSNTCYVTFKLFNHLFLSLLICGQQKWKILGSLQNRRFFFQVFRVSTRRTWSARHKQQWTEVPSCDLLHVLMFSCTLDMHACLVLAWKKNEEIAPVQQVNSCLYKGVNCFSIVNWNKGVLYLLVLVAYYENKSESWFIV